MAPPDGRFAEVLWVILAARSWGLEVQRDVLGGRMVAGTRERQK